MGTLSLAICMGLFAHPLGDAARLQTSLQMAEAAQAGSSEAQTFIELYVLDGGVPVPGVEAKVDGRVVATTDEYGAIYARIPSGRVNFELVREGEIIYRADLLTDEGELIQIILPIPVGGGEPKILIENSGRSSILANDQGDRGTDAPSAEAVASPGALVGRVISSESGEPVIGARIFFTGTRIEAETDDSGEYAVELPSGTYSISVIRPGYATQTIDDVRVIPGKEVTANIELSPSGVRLKDYVVTAPYIEGSIASTLEQQREASGVSDVLGAAQISATGDSNAAEALSRVTGLTIEEGRFVLIRGQPYRFTLALFNDSPLPSPEPLLKIVPLDLFPAGVLKDIEVQKAFTPDVPATFGAGLVRINTRGVPDEGFARLSLSTTYNSESAFLQGLSYDGGSLDVFGFDDGTRALPDAYQQATNDGDISINEADDPDAAGRSFSNNFDTNETTLPPDFGASLSAGNSWKIGGDGRFGITGTYQYNHKWRRQRRIQNDYDFNNGLLVDRDLLREFRTDRKAEMSGLLTAAFNSDKHELASNTFLVNQAQDRTQFTTGREVGSDQLDIQRTLLNWIERSLIAQQLSGHHDLGPVVLDYRGLVARAARNAPDRRTYQYARVVGNQTNFFIRDPLGMDREFSEVEDLVYSGGIDVSIPALAREQWFFRVTPKLGAFINFTDREAGQERLRWTPASTPEGNAIRGITDPEVAFDPADTGTTLRITDLAFGAGNDYVGFERAWALYGMLDMYFGEYARLAGGVRYEKANVEVETLTDGPPGTEGNSLGGFEQAEFYPSAALTIFLPYELQLRAAYGESTSRPSLNELSTTIFTDPDSGQRFIGDDGLQPTDIRGFDLRLEWYPSTTESLSFGVFQKEYENVIERTFTAIGGGGALATFQNAPEATVRGIEFGGRLEFGRFIDWFEAPSFFDKIYALANASVLFSEVRVEDSGAELSTVLERSLEGQADYVVNVQVGYDGDVHDITLAFNQVGSRLRRVGLRGQPNIIQDPISTLDINWSWQIWENGKMRLSGSNLLNPAVRLTQTDPERSAVFREFRRGAEVGLSFAWTFL